MAVCIDRSLDDRLHVNACDSRFARRSATKVSASEHEIERNVREREREREEEGEVVRGVCSMRSLIGGC